MASDFEVNFFLPEAKSSEICQVYSWANLSSDIPAPTAGLYLFLLHPKRVRFPANSLVTAGVW